MSSGFFGGADPFLALRREMNRVFDDVATVAPMLGREGEGAQIAPQINVSETDKEIRITAELPGVSPNDLQIDLDDDVLTMRGEKKREHREEKESFHFMERSYGSFHRALRLPFAVDPEKVQATFENGVLSITLPRTVQQGRSHRIQVKGGEAGQTIAQAGAQDRTAGSGEQGGQGGQQH